MVLGALTLEPTAAAAAQVNFQIITYMSGLDQPAGVTEGSPGVFYSTSGAITGALLSLNLKGQKKVLESFPSGYAIESEVVSGANGRFYSSVDKATNPDAVFSVTSAGDPKIYANQTITPILNQNLPDGSLLGFGANGNVVWSVITSTLEGAVTSIFQFPPTDYLANAIYASDGNYYGVFYNTNALNVFAYRVTPAGVMTQLVEFPFHNLSGGYAFAPLLEASDGNLYGAIFSGGANGTGFIYKLTLSGQYTLLYSFPAGHYSPTALIEGSDGNLYGATLGLPGTSELFRITKAGQYTTLYVLSNPTLDGACTCRLTLGSDGIIYGSAQGSGVYLGGAYFAFDVGLPKPQPRPREFNPKSGAVGTKVLIWGSNLLSASVTFNGIPASSVTVSGPNYVWATVPAGASSGPITVTTPGGTNSTKGSFTVE